MVRLPWPRRYQRKAMPCTGHQGSILVSPPPHSDIICQIHAQNIRQLQWKLCPGFRLPTRPPTGGCRGEQAISTAAALWGVLSPCSRPGDSTGTHSKYTCHGHPTAESQDQLAWTKSPRSPSPAPAPRALSAAHGTGYHVQPVLKHLQAR